MFYTCVVTVVQFSTVYGSDIKLNKYHNPNTRKNYWCVQHGAPTLDLVVAN